MAEFRGLQVASLLLLLLHLTAAVTGETFVFLNVTAGEKVTLPSAHVIEDQDRCDASTWLHSKSGASEEVFSLGKIKNNETNRLSLTANCSLVIRHAKVRDGGRYTYRQFDKAGDHQGPDVQVELSVNKRTTPKERDGEKKNDTLSENRGNLVWLWVLVPAALAALSVAVAVAVVRRRRATGSRTRMDESVEPIADREATAPGPEVDPEEGVSYASISYTKKADGGAQARVREDEDEDDEVTYSCVKS